MRWQRQFANSGGIYPWFRVVILYPSQTANKTVFVSPPRLRIATGEVAKQVWRGFEKGNAGWIEAVFQQTQAGLTPWFRVVILYPSSIDPLSILYPSQTASYQWQASARPPAFDGSPTAKL